MGKCVERNGIVYRLVSYDLVEVLDCAGERLGNIFINDGDWDLILGGADPIADGWEDGNGNALSCEGWGE